MKTAIIGSRNIDMEIKLSFIPTQIISGGAKGIDSCAKEYALRNNIHLVEYLPEYEKYRRAAPIVRNKKIVDDCEILVAYWDGVSKGTKFTIDYAKKQGKKIIINMI